MATASIRRGHTAANPAAHSPMVMIIISAYCLMWAAPQAMINWIAATMNRICQAADLRKLLTPVAPCDPTRTGVQPRSVAVRAARRVCPDPCDLSKQTAPCWCHVRGDVKLPKIFSKCPLWKQPLAPVLRLY